MSDIRRIEAMPVRSAPTRAHSSIGHGKQNGKAVLGEYREPLPFECVWQGPFPLKRAPTGFTHVVLL